MNHKETKDKSYFTRLQVHYRRRREGKTDYQARKNMIVQDQRSINTPKHRLVVRRTNRCVIAQIILATIQGDKVLCSAYSTELKKYGIAVGLTNYAACYATGLLVARRLLKKLKLDTLYAGVSEITGKDKAVEANKKGPRPFKAYLDTGLVRTSTGARVFAVMKGACDGGLNVPHNVKRFVGFNRGSKKFDAAVLREHIFGIHVSKYMKELQKDDPEAYKRQFSAYEKAGITADKIEEMYKKAHAAIREKPEHVATTKNVPEKKGHFNKKAHMDKFPLKLRQARWRMKLDAVKRKMKNAQAVFDEDD
ncbi:putative 60S ribosomal protein L5 [Blattamonas nauphoetae]|uniref:60S ribosomal protein L5 n=1 Tax=Blattamonas nauphoetae TaxID=2049346 RepID=A0ABQ9X8L6_9EUKA|nr:putative 60S ribosomal protein L5 [Blattamonas nauphoetae]